MLNKVSEVCKNILIILSHGSALKRYQIFEILQPAVACGIFAMISRKQATFDTTARRYSPGLVYSPWTPVRR